MSHALPTSLSFALLLLVSGCSSNYALVKKSEVSAAEQCLISQKHQEATIARQQAQLAETLELLQQTIELQQQGDSALREFMQVARRGLEERTAPQCTPAPRQSSPTGALDKKVVGGTERVLLSDLGIILQARVDTGSATSQIDAREIEFFERNGEEWVRFEVSMPGSEERLEVERPRLRGGRASDEDGGRRPVVEMRITMGSLTQMAELTLVNRSESDYPLVVGRNILRDLMLVDVARKNITEPQPPNSSVNDGGAEE